MGSLRSSYSSIAILVVLIGKPLLAVQPAREAACRPQYVDNLKQIYCLNGPLNPPRVGRRPRCRTAASEPPFRRSELRHGRCERALHQELGARSGLTGRLYQRAAESRSPSAIIEDTSTGLAA